jgi:ATPase subunit of ABC transporter with duplicated ATPase domains
MKFLDLVPSWVYAAAIALLVVACGWFYVAKIKAQGELATYRAEVAENTRKAEAEARAKEQAMQVQVERIAANEAKKTQVLAARVAAADSAARGLRDDIERLNARPAPEDPESAAYAREARTARELLGACAAEYRAVAEGADQLRDQVTGLQDYASNVCQTSR